MTLTLSQVPATTPYAQYIATASQTVFPYPFPVTADQDLVVVVNGVTYSTDVGYTLSGQGQPTGGFVTFAIGLTAGDIVTVYRDIVISRVTQIAQNSGFSSTAFNAEFNNIYLILQQLAEQQAFALQIPNSNNPNPITTLVPGSYANTYLSFDSNGNPVPALLTSSGSLTAPIIGALLYPRTAEEVSASVTPTYYYYPAGDVRRYGADPTGVAAADTAFANCMLCAGKNDVIVDGTFSLTAGGIVIPSNTNVRFTSGSKIVFTGTGACLVINSGYRINLYEPYVDMTNAGLSAIGIGIYGAWFLRIVHPKFAGSATVAVIGGGNTNFQTAIQLVTAEPGRVGNTDFGAYMIDIDELDCAISGSLKYGINSNRQTGFINGSGGATFANGITHLFIRGGWTSQVLYPCALNYTGVFRIEGFTPEVCYDGILIANNCNSGFISPGEMDCTNYGINFGDTTSANMTVIAPALAGSVGQSLGTSPPALINTNFFTPVVYKVDQIRLYGSNQDAGKLFYYDLTQKFLSTAVMVETVGDGTAGRIVRNYNANLPGMQHGYVAGISGTSAMSNNLRGNATFAASATKTVTFGTNEADASYFIALSGNAAGYCWVTAKGTTGFTINCSAVNSNVVDWILIR